MNKKLQKIFDKYKYNHPSIRKTIGPAHIENFIWEYTKELIQEPEEYPELMDRVDGLLTRSAEDQEGRGKNGI